MRNPANKVFGPDDFYPGEVRWDSFDVDPTKPLLPQMYEFDEDLIWVQFPNDCSLHIDWSAHPEHQPEGEFVVSLVHNPFHWEPFLERRCRSVSELRAVVVEVIKVASERPSVRKPLVHETDCGAGIVRLNQLIFDPRVSLDFQIDALKERLLDIRYPVDGCVVTASWTVEHSITGEFLVTVRRDVRDMIDQIETPLSDDEVTTLPTVWEYRCDTVAELRRAIERAINIAGTDKGVGS